MIHLRGEQAPRQYGGQPRIEVWQLEFSDVTFIPVVSVTFSLIMLEPILQLTCTLLRHLDYDFSPAISST